MTHILVIEDGKTNLPLLIMDIVMEPEDFEI